MDVIAGHELLSFIDVYLGYIQILVHEPDDIKTTFVTYKGLYFYKMMPFGSKNVTATYQILVCSPT